MKRSGATATWTLGALLALAGAPARALADHPGALRDAPMSPLTLGLLSGGLALAVGLVVVALVTLLGKRGDDA